MLRTGRDFMKLNTNILHFALVASSALLIQVMEVSTAGAIAATPTPTPLPTAPSTRTPTPPPGEKALKPLSKVCVNLQTGGVAVRPECIKPAKPFAPQAEAEVPAGTTNIGVRAYGFVFRGGALDKSRSSANVSSRRLNKQVYCVRATGIDPRTGPIPVTSVDFSLSECPDKPVLPISRNINSGCRDDEYAFIVWGCTNKPEPGRVYDDGNAFSFIIP